MTLRSKLLLAQLPLVAALAVTAGGALYAAVRFGAAPDEILHQNFRSFDAGGSMRQAMDVIEQSLLSAPGSSRPGATADTAMWLAVASFDRELRLQESNVTEPGEPAATTELRRVWTAYRSELDGARTPERLAALGEMSRALHAAVDAILDLNRAAMRLKSERARSQASRIAAALTASTLIAFLLAVVASGVWLRRILAPVRVLARAVQRLTEGDFDARIRIDGNDEIASLSTAFNVMADRLAEYRESSLGELLVANNRLASVLDSLADAVVVYDLDGAPLAHNEVATDLLGSDGLDLATLPETLRDVVRAVFERVRSTGGPHEPGSLQAAVELPGSPAPRWVQVSGRPVRTGFDVLSGVTVALRDVTRSRRLDGFKRDLVAAAAHELRTPLTSLHMAVHLCLEQAAGPLTDRQQDLLVAGRQDCERLETVVGELLEMARLESGAARLQRASLNLGELVREAVARHEAQARQRGTDLAVLPGDSLLSVEADAARLRHALDNLVDNAILHAGDAGRIVVGFEGDDRGARIVVDDSGPGIPAELREQVFNKFFRVPGTARQGSGLGLSIVQDIARAHGGEAGVEPSPLGGARFWLSLPRQAGASDRQDEPAGFS